MILKNNKGYVGIDISISLIIVLIIVPTIVGIVYNINKSKSNTIKKTEATSIAVNTIEVMKGMGIDNITDFALDDTINNDNPIFIGLKTIYSSAELAGDNKSIIITKDDITYKITFTITDYALTPTGENVSANSGVVKVVNVDVQYKDGSNTENVQINTAIS